MDNQSDNQIPRVIYYFNDIEMIHQSGSKELMRYVSELTHCFMSEKIIVLHFQEVLKQLKRQLKGTRFDLVLCIGNKGKKILEKIEQDITFDKCVTVNIKRVFKTKFTEGFECEYIYDINQDHINIMNEGNVLIIDDILYSGQTIDKVIHMLNIEDCNIAIASLISFKDYVAEKEYEFYHGYYVDKYTWPNDDAELWCLMDFVEETSLNLKDQKAMSIIDDEQYCKETIFGSKYAKAKEVVENIRKIVL